MHNTTYVDLPQRQPPKLLSFALCRGYTRAKAGDQYPAAPEINNDGHVVPTVLTVSEACVALRISKWTIYQLIRSRQLATIKIGKRRVIPATAIRALIERLQAEETA